MKSLRPQVEAAQSAPATAHDDASGLARTGEPRPLAPARWDWTRVRRVLVVRLRSIGDTVLATPSLRALRRFLPAARVDVLLEDWVAPLLEGSGDVDRVVAVGRRSSAARFRTARALRAEGYDVVYHEFDGGHVVPPQHVAEAARWLTSSP